MSYRARFTPAMESAHDTRLLNEHDRKHEGPHSDPRPAGMPVTAPVPAADTNGKYSCPRRCFHCTFTTSDRAVFWHHVVHVHDEAQRTRTASRLAEAA